ncbi:transposable element Tcb2 transposase [Trichonephila clavipes]|nr:transposable element Tcb2 transposase [Trichonephila clavipes]
MSLRRRRSHYQQLNEFERGRQQSRDGTASRRPGSRQLSGATEREDRHIRRTDVTHLTASADKILATIGTSMTQRTVGNLLLQGQLSAMHLVARIPLTPSDSPFATPMVSSQSSLEDEVEICCVFDESRFCLGVSYGRVLVRRRPEEHL